MLNERIEAARPIAKKITEAENSLNESLKLIGELLYEIPKARQQFAGRVPLTVGMEATERLAAAAVAATTGYKEIVEAHGHLADDRNLVGLQTVGFGDIGACPPSSSAHPDSVTHLNVVKAA